jgi:hypothetical protein
MSRTAFHYGIRLSVRVLSDAGRRLHEDPFARTILVRRRVGDPS